MPGDSSHWAELWGMYLFIHLGCREKWLEVNIFMNLWSVVNGLANKVVV